MLHKSWRHEHRPIAAVSCVASPCDDAFSSVNDVNPYNDNDEFAIPGSVNGIATDLLVDTGAKKSILSSDFISDTSEAVTSDVTPVATSVC